MDKSIVSFACGVTKFKGVIGKAILCLLALTLGACSSNSQLLSPAEDELEASKEVAETIYKISVGDTLQVFVWKSPEFSVSIPVRPDGYISIPLVNDLKVVGRTTTDVAREIEEKLKSYIKFPKVTVMVTEFGVAYTQQVRVIGQAVEPRALPYLKQMTLLDLMIDVGGLAEYAAGNRAILIRGQGPQQKKISLRLDDLIKKGDVSKNISLQPGDVVIIPESYF